MIPIGDSSQRHASDQSPTDLSEIRQRRREAEAHFRGGRMRLCIDAAEASLAAAARTGYPAELAAAHLFRGSVALVTGDPRTAKAHLQCCLALRTENSGECCLLLGIAAWMRRFPTEKCLVPLVKSCDDYRSRCDFAGQQAALVAIASLLLGRRQERMATPYVQQLSELTGDSGPWRLTAICLEAWAAHLGGANALAVRLAGWAGRQATLMQDATALVLTNWTGAEVALATGDTVAAADLARTARSHLQGHLLTAEWPQPNWLVLLLVREMVLAAARRRLPRLQRHLQEAREPA